ncbi:MAG TPA: hypothetical protein VGF55_31030 [Gemmataceae bacterium]|jgi:hypothetical protein
MGGLKPTRRLVALVILCGLLGGWLAGNSLTFISEFDRVKHYTFIPSWLELGPCCCPPTGGVIAFFAFWWIVRRRQP